MPQAPEPAADLPGNLSLAYAEELYARFLADPGAVDRGWREYFEKVAPADRNGGSGFADRPQTGPQRRQGGLFRTAGGPAAANESPGVEGQGAALPARQPGSGESSACELADLQDRVDQLVRGG